MNRIVLLLALIMVLAGGCAHAPPPPSESWQSLSADGRDTLSLDQIQPPAVLGPASRPSSGEAPPEALGLYAQAVDDLLGNDAFGAVQILQKAIQIDPDSFDLYYTLGQAQLALSHASSSKSFDAFEQAAARKPDDLRIHLWLGQQYMDAGDYAKAIFHLRLALQTTQYQKSAPGSAAAELFLARALQHEGYDRAALAQYQNSATRLAQNPSSLRREPDDVLLIAGPDVIGAEIGELFEKHGRLADALGAYKPFADADPSNFFLQAKVVNLLAMMDQSEPALIGAAQVLDRFGGDHQSLLLFHEITALVGADRSRHLLQRLHDQYPDNRAFLLAVTQALSDAGKGDEAGHLLKTATDAAPGDGLLARRVFDFYMTRDQTRDGVLVLVAWLAAAPDDARLIAPLFEETIRPLRKNALQLAAFQNIQVEPPERAAHGFLISLFAGEEEWRRGSVAHTSLDRALAVTPPFGPAYRLQLDRLWARTDLSEDQKIEASGRLADAAQSAGSSALAEELHARSLINQNRIPLALTHLEQALRLGGDSLDLHLTYVVALQSQGRSLDAEQHLQKLIHRQPRADEAWEQLHDFYVNANREEDAWTVARQWIQTNPASPDARQFQVLYDLIRGRRAAAQEQLDQLLIDYSADPQILEKVQGIYARNRMAAQFLGKLQSLHEQQPANMILTQYLLQKYLQYNQPAEATRLLEESHKAVAGDADRLYQLATMYHEIGQARASENILGEVLQVDPVNPSASNDLGYAWADAGDNLDRAERMIRRAVAADPDNLAYLDSLGWVLYKRGRFAESCQVFESALAPVTQPDPAMLDHFGDDLYRMGRTADAQLQWQRSLERLRENPPGDDEGARVLRSVQRKLRAINSGQPAEVAPLASAAAPDPHNP